MKKTILNDITCFTVILYILFFLIILVLSLKFSNGVQNDTMVALVFGGLILFGLFLFICVFELVFFKESEVVSVKIYKRTRILYSEIVSIEECVKNCYVVSPPILATFVKICDCNEKKISILKDFLNVKKKIKLIEEMKQKVENVELQSIEGEK